MSDTPPATFPQTSRTTASRDRGRVSYERAVAHAVIDEAYHCHLGFVVADPETGAPEPRVLPTLHVRIDDTLYMHGSTGSRPLLAARSDERTARMRDRDPPRWSGVRAIAVSPQRQLPGSRRARPRPARHR